MGEPVAGLLVRIDDARAVDVGEPTLLRGRSLAAGAGSPTAICDRGAPPSPL